jgi:dTDP-glucose 4,6-dehydratase
VSGLSRSEELNPVFLPYRQLDEQTQSRFSFRQLDLNNDLVAIMELIREKRVAYVVNFASQSMVAESWQNPDHWMMTNVVSTIRLHEELRKCDFLQKYLHISTPEVYGSCSGLIPESTVYNPSTPYAVSRAAADMSLMTYFRQYNFPVLFTRAANVFGPGQQLYRIVPRTVYCALVGEKLQLHGGGHSVRSFIHITDVCEATLLAMEHSAPGEIYHLSTDLNISIRNLVEMIVEGLGKRFDDCVEIVDDRPGKDSAYLLDSANAHRKLGWRPRISLEEGVADTIAWVRGNLATLKEMPGSYNHKP